MKISQATEFCYYKWETNYINSTILMHDCYLDKGHKGDHKCGDCNEFPLELHNYRELPMGEPVLKQDGPETVRREKQWILQYTEILNDVEDEDKGTNSLQCESEQVAREIWSRHIKDAACYGDTLKDATITEMEVTSRVIQVINLEGTNVKEQEGTQVDNSKEDNEANKEANETNMVNTQQDNESNDDESSERT